MSEFKRELRKKMKQALEKKMDEAKDAAAIEFLDEAAEAWDESKRQTSLMLLGGIHVARNMSVAISSEVLRALAEYGKGGHYRALGYKTFADFLNNSEYSPMSKSQFFEKHKFLQNEGAENFDLLNALNIPVRKRRLLAKGNVEIEGNEVIVKDGDTETTIEITDRDRLLETLSALADANAEKSKKLEKGEQDFKKAKDRIRELEDAPAGAGGKLSQGEQLAATALSSLAGLCAWMESATMIDVSAFIQRDLNLFAGQYKRMFAVIAEKGYEADAVAVINTDEENRLAALLDDEED